MALIAAQLNAGVIPSKIGHDSVERSVDSRGVGGAGLKFNNLLLFFKCCSSSEDLFIFIFRYFYFSPKQESFQF